MYRSTEKMNLQPIPMESYLSFAQEKMKLSGKALDEAVFQNIYQRFDGYTWYIQYILNRLFEKTATSLEEKDVDVCLADIIQSETDSYQLLYSMLTENQSALLRTIARERCVAAINGAAFIKKYGLKGTSSINAALKVLVNKEYVFRSENGYRVYDRFMELWLQSLPYSGQ